MHLEPGLGTGQRIAHVRMHGCGQRVCGKDILSPAELYLEICSRRGCGKDPLPLLIRGEEARAHRFGGGHVDDDARSVSSVAGDGGHLDHARLARDDASLFVKLYPALGPPIHGGIFQVVASVFSIEGEHFHPDVLVVFVVAYVDVDHAVFGIRLQLHSRDGDVHRDGGGAGECHQREEHDEGDYRHERDELVSHLSSPPAFLHFSSNPLKR